jgi:quercetin 2,3-dioxygenase
MSYRKVVRQTFAEELRMGPMKVKQPLPKDDLEQVSPFILLHHAGPDSHAAGKPRTRLNPHPHRGFEPVTFLYNGKIHHKDSLGNEGFLESGDVQWMTAGSGIIHSEGPSAQFAREGGNMELIQLWVNLPREFKMTQPKYQDIKREIIPAIDQNGFHIQIVAGTFQQQKGPASTFTPITALMMHFDENGETEVSIPESYNALVYVLGGQVASNGSIIDSLHLAVFDHVGDSIQLKAQKGGRLLFLAGVPINEPMSSYGPFVMNYPGEIKQAILDYETGKMGTLIS